MADNLPDEIERLTLDWLNGVAVTQPVAPLKVRLTTTAPTDTVAGTEASGDLYTNSISAALGAATTTSGVSKITNAATVTIPGISSTGAVAIAGVELWDSGSVPRRIAYHVLSPTVNILSGQNVQFAAGALSLTLA